MHALHHQYRSFDDLRLTPAEMYAEHTGNTDYLRPHEGDWYVVTADSDQVAGPFGTYADAKQWTEKLSGPFNVRVCQYQHAQPHWLAS